MPSFDIEINFNINTDALTEAETELQNISSSADEASSSADELSDSVENVQGSSLQETSGNAEELADSLNQATQSSEGLGESLGLIEGGMLLSIGDQFGSMGGGAESMAHQIDEASISVGQLATQTGMAEGDMVDLINHISNVTFPQNEAMAYVKSLNQMGVESDKLGSSATNMDRINDATGIGYNKVIQLTQGFRSLGVEVDDLPSTFNAIAYAQSNVTGGADTLSMVMKSQGGVINEYGLNADQLVVIMKRLSEQGYSQRKMGSQLSKVLKENNGDISAVEQSLGLQAGALSNASNETSKYEGELMQLADEEMEHKTITERMGAVWEDMSLKLSGVLSPMANVGSILGRLGDVGMTIRGLRAIGQSMRDVTTAINIMRDAESLSAGVKAVLSTALGIETVAEEANAGAKTSSIIPTQLLAIAENSLLLPILLVVGAIALLIAGLWYLYNNNETVRIGINMLIAKFQEFLMKLDIVKNMIIAFVLSVIERFTHWKTRSTAEALWLVENIYNTLATLPSKVNSAVSGITEILTKPFKDAWNDIEKELGKIGDGLNKLNPTSWFGVEYEGFNSVSYEGFSSLNGTISSGASNSSSITNNFNINGIIEEQASEYIVESVNGYIKKQNLIRGA